MIHILYFAGLKEVTGKNEEFVPWSRQTVADLLEWGRQRYHTFPTDYLLVSVNETYVTKDYPLESKDRVAFIPPVSGG